jgi:hypothetical protein
MSSSQFERLLASDAGPGTAPVDETAIKRADHVVRGATNIPLPPTGLRSRYSVRDGRVVIETPYVALLGCLAFWVLLLLAFLGLALYLLVHPQRDWVEIGICGFVGSLLVVVVYRMIWPVQIRFEVDPSRLAVRQRGLILRGAWFDSQLEVPAGEIEKLGLRGLLVHVQYRGGDLELALPVEPAEAEWIHVILCQVAAC